MIYLTHSWISHSGGRQLLCCEVTHQKGSLSQTTKVYQEPCEWAWKWIPSFPRQNFSCNPSWLLHCNLMKDLEPEAEDKSCPDSWARGSLKYLFSQVIKWLLCFELIFGQQQIANTLTSIPKMGVNYILLFIFSNCYFSLHHR